MPRVGVELFQYMRFTVSLHTCDFSLAYPMLSLGIVLGVEERIINNHRLLSFDLYICMGLFLSLSLSEYNTIRQFYAQIWFCKYHR